MVERVNRKEQTQSKEQPKEISKSLAKTGKSVSELISQKRKELLRPGHTISKNVPKNASKVASMVENSNFSMAGSPLKLKASLKTPKVTNKVNLLTKKTKRF